MVDMDDEIQTQIDGLLSSLKVSGGKPISVKDLSSITGLSQPDIFKWLTVLEKSNQVQLSNRIEGVYASWIGSSSDHPLKTKPYVDSGALDAKKTNDDSPIPLEIFDFENRAKSENARKIELKKKHLLIIESADSELASAAEKLIRIDKMLADYQKRKADIAAKQENAAVASVPVDLPVATEYTVPDKKVELPVDRETKDENPEPDNSIELLADEGKMPAQTDDVGEGNRASQAKASFVPFISHEKPSVESERISPRAKLMQRIIPISRKRRANVERIKKAEPLQVTSISLQFSEKLAKQMRKILSQSQEIEKLRMQKEQLLTEHYVPMQRRLECEIETISERVLRMEKGVLNMQMRAASLPSHVSSVEKMQISTIKAHAEMRKAYDEASALIEESSKQLSDERERMEMLADHGRGEISAYEAKSNDLQNALVNISEMEEEAKNLVTAARASLAEQAGRLSIAEKHSRELSVLREEISDGVGMLKRELSQTKGMLTTLEKELNRMRQVEEWANTVRQDYESKMLEIDEYIRTGNHEFETLRESVEANFVRRYLHELRSLTDSYSFEFNQAKNAEETLEERISKEKRKFEQLLDNGRQLAYLYETRIGKSGAGPDVERYGKAFSDLSDISSQRTQLQSAIAQLIGERTKHQQHIVLEQKATEKESTSIESGVEKPIFAKRKLLAPRTIDKVHVKPAAIKSVSKKFPAKRTSSKKSVPASEKRGTVRKARGKKIGKKSRR